MALVRIDAQTSRERGLLEVAKAERQLVAKNSYRRRTVRDPGSELDVMAAAMLMLEASHKKSILPWRRRRQMRDGLKGAIARSYLNAPYTTGGF